MALTSWLPATLDNINQTVLTFSAGGELHVRVFGTQLAAFDVVQRVGTNFEYSPERNRLRAAAAEGGVPGEEVPLPPARDCAAVDHTRCGLVADGHRPHWIPVTRAANSRDGKAGGWTPVEILQVEGTRVTFATNDGVVQGWFHNPDVLATGWRYHPKWRVLEAASGEVAVLAAQPIGACWA